MDLDVMEIGRAAARRAKSTADTAVKKAGNSSRMEAMQKARRASAAAKAPAERVPFPRFQAPADFKPAFYTIEFGVGADGIVDPTTWKATRIQGKLDNSKAKINQLEDFDQVTSLGLIARISAALFQPNLQKRLDITPEGTLFRVFLRASKRSADNTLSVSVKMIQRSGKNGKFRPLEDKTDPTVRRIRRIARLAPSAFVDAQQPPRARRGKKEDEEAED